MRSTIITIAFVALAAMQHDMSHMSHQHAAPNPSVTINTAAPRSSTAPVDPAATLKPDDFDAPKTPQQASAKTTESYYTCPMHPQIHSATPGKCPICGMTLVKKEQ